MILRMIFAAIFIWTMTGMNGLAQTGIAGQIYGRVIANGRYVNWTVEIRLERQDASLVSSAYTHGASDFSFIIEPFDPNEHYYLIVREPGYKEVRFPLEMNYFGRRQFSKTQEVYTYNGLATLELEKLPNEKTGPINLTGSKVVDVQNLKSQIPDGARREYDLAMSSLEGGDSKAALKHLERSVELAPEYYDAVNRLGAEYLKAGELEKAESMLNRARVLNPKDPSPLTNLGALYFQQGERAALSAAVGADTKAGSKPGKEYYRKAVDVLERALRLGALEPRASFYLGTALYGVGDYQKAEPLLLNALAMDKRMYEARLSLVNVYIRQKRYDAALKQISIYLEENPNAPRREQVEKLKAKIESALKPEKKK